MRGRKEVDRERVPKCGVKKKQRGAMVCSCEGNEGNAAYLPQPHLTLEVNGKEVYELMCPRLCFRWAEVRHASAALDSKEHRRVEQARVSFRYAWARGIGPFARLVPSWQGSTQIDCSWS